MVGQPLDLFGQGRVGLRFAWRGDRLERAVLLRLGELYERQGAYRRALHTLRQAASYFPERKGASAVAQRMRALFVDVHLGRTERAAAGIVRDLDHRDQLVFEQGRRMLENVAGDLFDIRGQREDQIARRILAVAKPAKQ